MLTLKKIKAYKKIYDLPELEYEEQISKDYFALYKKHYFAIISIYNIKNEYLLIRDFNKNIGWELPGGYINNNENIEDAANRIVLDETGLEIDELSPIAIVKNTFKCDNKKIIHLGIAFMALSRGKTKIHPKNIEECFVKNIPGKIAFQNEKIINILRKKLNVKKYRPPFNEIENIKSKKFALIYFLHKYVIKKIGSLSSMKIEKTIFKIIEGHPKTVLDASCGDSPIINNLYNKYSPDICIGNDISWKTISLIKNKNPEIIFTNHNVLDLPYKIKFDLIIFKNTLHHIEREDQLKVLKNLLNLSKQLIIIDIDNPKKSNLLSKLWNNYYVYLLGDQGNSFLTFREFKKFINQNYHTKLKIGTICTIKGNYYYASIKN